MLRYGWGVTGNQFIPPGRIVARYGGSLGDAYYDVNGSNTTVVGGYRQVSQGNPDLKWEENRSTNIGADMVLFDGLLNVVLDVYRRQTNNLLFDPRQPATAGDADPPIINVGKMRNTGFDQVSEAIQFMLDLQIDPALAREMDLVVGEEVTIVHLSARQKGDK